MPVPGENIQSWSTTATDNSSADSLINWAEGMPRADVNNSARAMMAAHAKDRNLHNASIVTGGTADAQTFTSGVTYTAIPTGLRALLKIGPTLTNTGAMTLEMDGLGAVAVKYPDATDIIAGGFTAGSYVELVYSGTNWVLLHSVPATAVEATPPGVITIINTIITAPAASLDLTTDIDDTFAAYLITGVNVVPVPDEANFYFRISEDAGATFKAGAGDYRYAAWTVTEEGVTGALYSPSPAFGAVNLFTLQDNLATRGLSFSLYMFGPAQTTGWKTFTWDGTAGSNVYGMAKWNGSAVYDGTNNAINGIRFFFSAGQIASGTFSLYGVK